MAKLVVTRAMLEGLVGSYAYMHDEISGHCALYNARKERKACYEDVSWNARFCKAKPWRSRFKIRLNRAAAGLPAVSPPLPLVSSVLPNLRTHPCRPLAVSPPFAMSVKVRRGRREGDGTENVMTDRPSHARWFCPLGPLTSLTSVPLFCTSEDINGRGGGGGL